jgi:hypothetical protein
MYPRLTQSATLVSCDSTKIENNKKQGNEKLEEVKYENDDEHGPGKSGEVSHKFW